MNLHKEHRLIHLTEREKAVAARKAKRLAGTTPTTPTPTVNPRSSAGQAGAARPTGVSTPGTSSGTRVGQNFSSAQQRWNEAIATGDQRAIDRAQAGLAQADAQLGRTIGVDRGVQGSTGIRPGTPTNFENLAEAEAQAERERIATGTVSPETAAAIERGRSDPTQLNIDPSIQGSNFVPSPFGEIDEAAGERMVFDAQGVATVQDAQGNILRTVGDGTTIGERTDATRQAAGSPFQDPRSGAMGQAGATGYPPLDDINAQIKAVENKMGTQVMVPSASGRMVVGHRETSAMLNSLRAEKSSLEERKLSIEQQRQADVERRQGQAGLSPEADATVTTTDTQAPDRQAWIEQQREQGRSEGKSEAQIDAGIQEMIRTLPPEQTGGVPTTPDATATGAPAPTGAPPPTGTTPTATDTQGTPEVPTEPVKTEEEIKQETSHSTATANKAQFVRNLAASVEDPTLRAVIEAYAGQLEAIGIIETPKSFSEFSDSATGEAIEEPYSAISEILKESTARAEKSEKDRKAFLQSQFNSNNERLAAEQENINNQLIFANNKAVRDQNDANKKMLDSQTIMLALGGGFGSADGNREIAEARMKGEQAIIDLNKEYGFKKTDVSLEFTRLNSEAEDNYRLNWMNATDTFNDKISNLDIQGISNQQALSTAMTSAYTGYVKDIKDARSEKAKLLNEANRFVYDDMIQTRKTEQEAEQTALSRIDYLLENYPRESVAEAIKELGKDVKSFDVQALIDNPTLSEIEKAEKAFGSSVGGVSSYTNQFLPPELQGIEEPEISLEDYMQQKLAVEEELSSQSLSDVKKAELIEENRTKWQEEYDAMYTQNIKRNAIVGVRESLVSQYGEAVVIAADSAIDGTFGGTNPVKTASEALNVNMSDVALAYTALRREGAVQDTKTLSPSKLKVWNGVIDDIEKDVYYTVWNGARSAVTRITEAAKAGSAVADIALINAFQNGIVDPGATVREGDVHLIQSAIGWFKQLDPKLVKNIAIGKAKIPQSMRNEMLSLAKDIEAAYGRDFNNIAVPKFKTRMTQSGLPISVLDEYLGAGSTINQGGITVSPEVTDFLKNY
jgi:hypothetical protein